MRAVAVVLLPAAAAVLPGRKAVPAAANPRRGSRPKKPGPAPPPP
eukprot:gene24889-60866_t